MSDYLVNSLMVPLSEYATVSGDATLYKPFCLWKRSRKNSRTNIPVVLGIAVANIIYENIN